MSALEFGDLPLMSALQCCNPLSTGALDLRLGNERFIPVGGHEVNHF
jgi:hypothetical protein